MKPPSVRHYACGGAFWARGGEIAISRDLGVRRRLSDFQIHEGGGLLVWVKFGKV